MDHGSLQAFLNVAGWKSRLEGWAITDCAIRDKNILCLLARKVVPHDEASLMWDSEIPTRLVVFYLHRSDPDKCHEMVELARFNKPKCGTVRAPYSQALVVSRNEDGDVFLVGGGRPSEREEISNGAWPGIQRIKCLDDYAFAVCQSRRIFKREKPGVWRDLTPLIPRATKSGALEGFRDMDGSERTGFYAVGDGGDVWRLHSGKWTRCAFPSNETLSAVAIAPDGKVLIGGEAGNLWEGREDSWKRVYEGSASVLYNDIAFFQGALWVSSDYGLKVWNGSTLERPNWNGEEIIASGHMDVQLGMLLVAEETRVQLYDGTSWRTLVRPYA